MESGEDRRFDIWGYPGFRLDVKCSGGSTSTVTMEAARSLETMESYFHIKGRSKPAAHKLWGKMRCH